MLFLQSINEVIFIYNKQLLIYILRNKTVMKQLEEDGSGEQTNFNYLKTTSFGIKFTTPELLSIEVTLNNPKDVLKLARLYELFLLEHDIPYTSTEKYGCDYIGTDRTYPLVKNPGKTDIDIDKINDAMNVIKETLTISEIEKLNKDTDKALEENKLNTKPSLSNLEILEKSQIWPGII